MEEPPVFGPNGAVLNSGTIPPEKIGLYDGSEPVQYAQPSAYTDVGKRYVWGASFLMYIILTIISFAGNMVTVPLALGLVTLSITFSFLALRHVSDESRYPILKRQTLSDLILLAPLSYALLIMNMPVQISILGFVWASLFLNLLWWIAGRLFPSPRTIL